MSLRLFHVDLPAQIGRVRKVDSNARQLEMLFLLHTKAEPIAGNEKPPISVDIEALMRVPAVVSGSTRVCFGTNSAVVG